MKTKIALAVAAAFSIGLSGCTSLAQNNTGEPMMKAGIDNQETRAKETKPVFSVRSGDRVEHVLARLGQLNGNVYILEGKTKPEFTVASAPVGNEDDVRAYVEAMGFDMTVSTNANSIYKRVSFKKQEAPVRGKKDCNTTLFGTMPLGVAVADVCREAGLTCQFTDQAATTASAALYSLSYRGSCVGAIDALAQIADLSLSYDENNKVEIKLLDTVMLDLGIPMRDSKMAVDVVGASSSTNNQTTATTTGTSSTSNFGQNGKSIKKTYETNYLKDVMAMISQSLSSQGSYSLMPETGQVLVRDKKENLRTVSDAVSKLAAAYQTAFEIKLTFYRLSIDEKEAASVDISRAFNSKITAAISGVSELATGAGALGVAYKGSSAKAAFELLATMGTVESLEEHVLSTITNIPTAVNIGHKIDYVRNVTTTPSGVSGTVTSSAEQATVMDGGFINVITRKADADRIFLEVHAYLNHFDGFDVTKTSSTEVKSPQSFERTFDAPALLTDGVPYVIAIAKQNDRDDSVKTVPGAQRSVLAPLFGGRSNSSTKSYIVIIAEGRKQ